MRFLEANARIKCKVFIFYFSFFETKVSVSHVFVLILHFKAVKASWDMLSKEGRPDAKKVLVVVSDKKSESTDSEIQEEVKPLQENGVIVIPVALGDEADERQLKLLTDDERNLIKVKATNDTADIKDAVMVIVFKGLLKLTLQKQNC